MVYRIFLRLLKLKIQTLHLLLLAGKKSDVIHIKLRNLIKNNEIVLMH